MTRPTIVGLAFIAATAAWFLVRLNRLVPLARRATGRRRPPEDDCRSEECGADGTPLSLYAG